MTRGYPTWPRTSPSWSSSRRSTAHEHHLEEAKEKMYTLYKPFLDLMDVFNGRDMVRVDYHREDMWDIMRRFFEKYDLLLTPTTACPAFDLKEGGMLNPETIDG